MVDANGKIKVSECFRFGVDFIPKWFRKKLEEQRVDYEYRDGQVVAARFYTHRGVEKVAYVGYYIYKDTIA